MNLRSPRLIILLISLLCGIANPAFAVITGKDLLTDKQTEIKPGKKGTVLVFLSCVCPCSNSHVGIIKKLSAEFKDFNFAAVHSNADESTFDAKVYFKEANLPMPVIKDEASQLANEYQALKTPHAFVIDPAGKILYQGGVTNSTSGPTADRQLLRDALADADAGRPVKVAKGRALGCVISRGDKHDL